jgi:predicted nucleotidyltransferase
LNRILRDLAEEYAQGLRVDLGDDVISIVLFGSVARREATPYSDIDLLVVMSSLPRGRMARLERIRATDQRIETRLKDLRDRGIYSDVCPILKTLEEAARESGPYTWIVWRMPSSCLTGMAFSRAYSTA